MYKYSYYGVGGEFDKWKIYLPKNVECKTHCRPLSLLRYTILGFQRKKLDSVLKQIDFALVPPHLFILWAFTIWAGDSQ